MYKSYRYRLYPNKNQELQIQKTFNCVRFVYNKCLDYKIKSYKEDNIYLSKIDLNNYCNRVLKNEYEWLREVDKCSLTNSIYNMDYAFQKFFKENAGFPKFKSKRDNHKAYKTDFTNNNIEVLFDKNRIKLPKLKLVKCKIHRIFIGKIKSAVVSQTPSGKYYVSVLVEINNKNDNVLLSKSNNLLGIDLGIKDLIVTSNGEKFKNIRTFNKYELKLAEEQRKLSKKNKGSKNWNKQRIKVAKVYEKIKNGKLDYIHKITRKIVSENQIIVSENLKVANMVKNHNLAKSISDCSWYELTRQLDYKSKYDNKTYIKVDTYFPSSQLCSCCGYQNKEVKNLNIRKWTCPQCGKTHDRDINAAKNILHEGIRILNSN